MNSIYLDNAATSFPKPDCVYDAVDACLRGGGAAFGRGSHSGTSDVGRMIGQLRLRIAQLIGSGNPQQIAFTFNCTDGLNLLLRGVLRAGDRVITTELEHNSVLRPLQQLAAEFDLEIVRVPFDPGSGIVDCDALETALRHSLTKLVVVNHASNVTGAIQPIAQVIQAAHDANALVLLDAAQTAGHLPLSVQSLNIDLLAAAGHKGLLGPLGTGFVFIRDELHDDIRPFRSGGTGTSSESIIQPEDMPQKLESGNLNVPGLAGLNAAVTWIAEQSVAALHDRIASARQQLATGLRQITAVTVYGSDDTPNVGIVSFNIGELDCREVAMMLDQSYGIQCRAGLHCAPLAHQSLGTFARGGTIRLSPGPFTTDGQIAAAVDAVGTIAAAFR